MTGRWQGMGWQAGALGVLLALLIGGSSGLAAVRAQGLGASGLAVQEYAVAPGSRPHDAVPDRSGGVWYTGQGNGTVGRLDVATGDFTAIDLGGASAPHGVIMGPDNAV